MVAALPRDGHRLRQRWAIYVLGGPLANLVVAGVCVAISFWLNSARPDTPYSKSVAILETIMMPADEADGCLRFVAFTNLFYFLAPLVPGTVGRFKTDGAKLLELIFNWRAPELEIWLCVLKIDLANGIRPRDWDAAKVSRMLALRDGGAQDVVVNLYGYFHARDCGDIDRAGELLDLAVAQRKVGPYGYRPSILTEAAYFEGRYGKNAAKARERLRQAGDAGKVEDHTRLRAEAAVLLAEGRIAEATARVEEGLEALPRSQDRGGALAEHDWLNEILKAASVPVIAT